MNRALIPTRDIDRIVRGDHDDPFSVLGMHAIDTGAGRQVIVRCFYPGADSARVLADDGERYPLHPVHADGLFEGAMGDHEMAFTYELEFTHEGHLLHRAADPYAFPPLLSDFDLHLFGESTHLRIYDNLGAHRREVNGRSGVSFAVWAPTAKRVSIIGDFNRWDGRRHPMRSRGSSGVWELFVPGLEEGALYKFEIKTADGHILTKSDPFARRMELRPQTASIVADGLAYPWGDDEWLAQRARTDHTRAPISVYEVHPGSWRAGKVNFRELADELIPYVKHMGFTHVELMPIMEYPLDESWGYQVVGYYAPTSRHGVPADFQYFVDQCHREGVGVILDWVPAHFPSDSHGLAHFDGTALFEHADPRQGAHPDWGTAVFNYGRNEVRNFLCANALFWFEKYHIDGMRVDAVASMLYLDYSRGPDEWVANRFGGRENLEAVSFLRFLNETVYGRHPGALMIAEESTSWPAVSGPVYTGGLGFGFKWNMGWMHDTLDYMSKDPVYRTFHHDQLTFGPLYAFHENFVLVLSHDEVVHGKRSLLDKMPGDLWQKFANLRLLYGYMCAYPGKKLLFMGGEIGQWGEWNHKGQLDWGLLNEPLHAQLQTFVRDLNHLYGSEAALHDSDCDHRGFDWIDFHDAHQSVVSFYRRSVADGSSLCFGLNFTPVPRTGYRIGVPAPGYYREVVNSDAGIYGGSNMGNRGGMEAEETAWQGQPCSLMITLPPLSLVGFKVAERT